MTVQQPPDLPETVDERPHRRREWSGAWRSIGLPVLVVAAIVAAVWYLEVGRDAGRPETGDGLGVVALEAERNPTGRPPAAETGRAAPDFRLARLGGGDLRLSDLRGRPVIINFWATWCAPCRQEMPEFVRLYAQQPPNGVEIVGVDLQEAEAPVRQFVDEFGMTFPVVFDRTGEVARTYRVNQLPVTVIVDREGVVRAAKYGPVTPEWLHDELGKIP
jgi:cytochrome c biogenesis protein CcmG, thiol:disulfide interchange protein DsbE